MHDELPDYCAQCGTALDVLDHGARKQCCNGLGYWSHHVTPPDDLIPVLPSVKAPDGTKYYLYSGQEKKRWKPGMKKCKAKPKFITK